MTRRAVKPRRRYYRFKPWNIGRWLHLERCSRWCCSSRRWSVRSSLALTMLSQMGISSSSA